MRVRSFGNSDVFLISLLYILWEWLTQLTPIFAFPYARLAVCTAAYTSFIGSAALLGGLFISLLILLVNGTVCALLMSVKRPYYALRTTAVMICLLSVNYAFCRYALSHAERSAASECAVIQGNISSADKWRISSENSLDTFIRIAYRTVGSNTDLIVFPETTVTEPVTDNPVLLERIRRLSRDTGADVLTGTIYRDGGRTFNAMLTVYPDGSISQPYFKQQLVPFGEKVPFYSLMPESIRRSVTNFSAGASSEPVRAGGAKVGGIICFESIYPQLARAAVRSGAELLVVISNDSWFDNSAVPEQHFAHSVLRAVEMGRYTICCSNTGISAVVSPTGECLRAEPYCEQGLLSGYEKTERRTLYSVTGDIIILPGVLMVIKGACKRR